MRGYRLTVRHGATVERLNFDDLDAALAELERRVEEVRGAGPLDSVSALRRFEPGQRVAARLELSTGGWLRSREAGVDVMGDGSLVPYAGAVRKRPLEAAADRPPLEALREALR